MKPIPDRIAGLFPQDREQLIVESIEWPPKDGMTSVDDLHDRVRESHPNVDRQEIVALLKDLEEAGFGRFLAGRRGHPSRLEWSLEDVAESGEISDSEVSSLRHQFRLRRDSTVLFDLPEDLTKSEAQRLADFVLTLPFEG